jgi:uncharacterized protein YndB with AHSA1/START domain
MQTDRIEKEIRLSAAPARVWQALSNAQEFGSWFGMELAGQFAEGGRLRGRVTHAGYEHVTLEITVEKIVPGKLISWRWHPNAVEAKDYSHEPTTLVVFEIGEAPGGTLLRVVESGFDALPPERRQSAFRGNDEGWTHQMQAIARHLATGGKADAPPS